MMKGLVFVGLLLTAFFSIVLVPPGQAATYIVDDDDHALQWADFNTIQDAINASSTSDRIFVYNGTYYENIVVNQSVLMHGNGSGQTIIDGGDNGHIVSVESADVDMSGFGIQNAGNGQHGVDVDANTFLLDNCSVSDCNYRGVVIQSNAFLDIINCNISVVGNGIVTSYADYVNVTWSEINGAAVGMDILSPDFHTFANVSFWDCSIDWSANAPADYADHVIDNVTVNGMDLEFYYDVNNISITGDLGQVILGDCQDIVIEDFSAGKGTNAIHIGYCSGVTVRNVTAYDNYIGVQISQSNSVIVWDTDVTGFRSTGLEVSACDTANFTNLNVSTAESAYGMIIYSTALDVTVRRSQFSTDARGINSYADGVTVTNCTIDTSSTAIWINGGEDWTIAHNLITSSGSSGMYLNSGSNWNLIANNTIKNCWWRGIEVSSSNNNTFIYNEIFGGNDYGIQFRSGSRDNVVHHNNFYDNGGGSSQGDDDAGNNTWDDGVSEGNYWDDYGGSGNYSIDGSAGAVDRYPLSDPEDNSAPEKVPGIHPFVSMAALIGVMGLFVRRHR